MWCVVCGVCGVCERGEIALVDQRRYDTRLSSRGCYFLIEGKKDKEVVKNAFQ